MAPDAIAEVYRDLPPDVLVFSVRGEFLDDNHVAVSEIEQRDGLNMSFLPSEIDLVLLDEKACELSRGPVRRSLGHFSPPAPLPGEERKSMGCTWFVSNHFTADVPARDGGVTLAIKRGDDTLWMQHAPGPRPQIRQPTCEVVNNVGHVKWTDNVSRTALKHVRPEFAQHAHHAFQPFSPIELLWEVGPLDLAPGGGALSFDVNELPPGDVLIRVVMLDGFYTVFSEPARVTIAERPPEITIDRPVVSNYPKTWGMLSFSARASTYRRSGGGIYDENAYRWVVNGVAAGTGSQLHIKKPFLGSHTVTVFVLHNNLETSGTMQFDVTPELLQSMADVRGQRKKMRKIFPHWDWP